jgi:hypothetical protein
MDPRLQQLERIEHWLETASPMQRFQAGVICALLPMLLALWLQSLLPSVPVYDPSMFDVGGSVERPLDTPPSEVRMDARRPIQ